jgi:hypothetical protein
MMNNGKSIGYTIASFDKKVSKKAEIKKELG